MSFHGSYRPTDVEFLLKPIEIEFTQDINHKESLIQSGKRHYSEMLSPEQPPSKEYLALFHKAHADNRSRLARDCLRLASLLHEHYGPDVTILSLARAGTPVGAILSRLIKRLYSGRPFHYSVSIIRDRGIDEVALNEVLARGHSPESIAFVDGWTGKGVISRELEGAIRDFNSRRKTRIDWGLNVLTDLAGSAARAASCEDYLIASSILNSTVSGLVSRSVLNEAIGPGDYHGCVFYGQFAPHDLSRWFVDDVIAAVMEIHGQADSHGEQMPPWDELAAHSSAYMAKAMDRYGIDDENLIKPGIGEATRVLLRRVPERVIVRDPACNQVRHLIALAAEKGVSVEFDPGLPYQAVSIIRSSRDARRH